MPDSLPISLRLDEPDRSTGSPVSRMVKSHLQSRGRDLADDPAALETLWSADFFGLDKVSLFRQAGANQQREILAGCARDLLNEAYFIEKSAGAYCAKMILLAERTEVRQIYALIAADEATHLQWVRPFVEEGDRGAPSGPLLSFLTELIGQCDFNTLAYLVQVILEGWGLHHYRQLSQSCRHPALRGVFAAIHKDEALHHHTGEVVFDPALITGAAQHALVRDSLRGYTEMVRVGPQGVVGALERTLGGLNRRERTAVFTELETEARSAEKLEVLRGLMAGPGRESYVAELEEQGAFTPYAPEACATMTG